MNTMMRKTITVAATTNIAAVVVAVGDVYQNHGGNRNNGGGGGGDHQNLSRQKHHATQMREKFANMARDAQNNGDRVDVEYYLQHVDHYTRVLTDIAVIEAERFAHQREQHQSQPVTESSEAAPTENGEATQHDATAEMQPYGNNQPRMTRQPRHQQVAASARRLR